MHGQEIGLIQADKFTHVMAQRLTGPQAVCNGDPILTRLPGGFDPSDPLAYVECARRLTAPG